MMKRTTCGVAVVLAMLAGCGGKYDDEPRGTGKLEKLYIRAPSLSVAAGLTATFRIRDVRTWPENSDPIDGAERLEQWDFDGTELEVEGPPGLDFEVTRRPSPASYLDSGYYLRLRCDAEPDRAHEVQLRVREPGGGIRYEDRFDVTCHEPMAMELRQVEHPYAAPAEPGVGRHFVGGAIEAYIVLWAGTRQVGGEDLTVTDHRGILRMGQRQDIPARNTGHILDVVAPGTEPELAYRNVTLKLPMEAVRDDEWRLELGPWQGPPGLDYAERRLDAIARGSDGSELRGLQRCTWSAGLDSQDTGCRFVSWGAAPQEVCVTAYERTACTGGP